MSFEKLAKENIKKLYPEAYVDSYFAKRFKGAYIDSFCESPNERLHVVPDCYFHFWQPKNDAEGGIDYFIICEVEDTNPLTKNKLGLYGRLWDMGHNNLEVWSFNRYGQFTTSHNLQYWYFYWLNYCWLETPNLDEEDLNKQSDQFKKPVREFMYRVMTDDRHFWMNLPWQPEGRKFWDYIKKYNPIILSRPTDLQSLIGKKKWVKDNLGLTGDKVQIRYNKSPYASYKGKVGILIDDFESNVSKFQAAGGRTILYKSESQAIKELKSLGF